jgi:ABC-type transport system involved in multi-copper enzyme maturation permease subunit
MRFSVLTRFSLGMLFQSRIFTGFVALCMIPQLIGAAIIYFSHSSAAALIVGLNMQGTQINNAWFASFLGVQAWLGFIIVAAAAPGMITRDFANQALQLYLSRPLSRAEYIAGKLSVLALLLSFFTWIPGLIFFGLQASLEGNGWGWKNLYLVGSIVVSGWLWIAVVSLFALALSVWVRWRIAATGLIFGSMFLLPAFGAVFNAVLGTNWGNLINLSYVMQIIWTSLYRIEPHFRRMMGADRLPVWSAWAAVIALCAFSLMVINQRLQAREVERG